jgi:hypothetical protein
MFCCPYYGADLGAQILTEGVIAVGDLIGPNRGGERQL